MIRQDIPHVMGGLTTIEATCGSAAQKWCSATAVVKRRP
jgi:hypothetical protein